jgi:hypothetical protein
VRLGAYIYPKYTNVSFAESAIVRKSEERNCRRDLSEGEGKLWEPNIYLGK